MVKLNPHRNGGGFLFFILFINMRVLIRKILKEQIELIRRNERYNSEVLPGIIEWINEKYGRRITVKTDTIGVRYANDDYSGKSVRLSLYLEDESLDPREVKSEIWNGLKNFFNIEMERYGSGMDLRVFKKKWEQV